MNGTLWENNGATGHSEDDCIGLVNNLVFSHQIIETKVNTYSYGGIVFWYQDNRTPADPNNIHFASVLQYGEGIQIMEVTEGGTSIHVYPTYSPIEELVWHDLEVDANNNSGKYSIYIDGNHVFTYDSNITKENRIGQSGVYAGNSGAYFDDFNVRSVPEPTTMLLLGIGLAGLAGVRRKIQK